MDFIVIVVKVVFSLPVEKSFEYLFIDKINSLPIIGSRVLVPFRKKYLIGIIISFETKVYVNELKIKKVQLVIDKSSIFTINLLKFLYWVSKYYYYPLGSTIFYVLPKLLKNSRILQKSLFFQWRITDKGRSIDLNSLSKNKEHVLILLILRKKNIFPYELLKWKISSTILKKLKKKGLCDLFFVSKQKVFWGKKSRLKNLKIDFNDIKNLINFDLFQKKFFVFLLSGICRQVFNNKFFIYLFNLILKKGLQILILVPDIHNMYKYVSFIKMNFSITIDYLHCNSSARDHVLTWNRVNNSEVSVLVGTKKSVFVPFSCLGLIVVVEEHDVLYKNSDKIFFNTRNIAIARAKIENTPIILVSNTPSLETLYNVDIKKYKKINTNILKHNNVVKLTKNLIDLNQNKIVEIFSYNLIKYLQESLNKNNKIILVLEKYISFFLKLLCKKCDWNARCYYCNCLYSFNITNNQLLCKNCFYTISKPEVCLECGSNSLRICKYNIWDCKKIVKLIFSNKKIFYVLNHYNNKNFFLDIKISNNFFNYSYILLRNRKFSSSHKTTIVFLSADNIYYSKSYRSFEYFSQFYFNFIEKIFNTSKNVEIFLQTFFPNDIFFIQLIRFNYFNFVKHILLDRQCIGLPPFNNHVLIRLNSVSLQDTKFFFSFFKMRVEKRLNMDSENFWIFGPFKFFEIGLRDYNSYFLVLQTSSRKVSTKLMMELAPILKKKFFSKKIKLFIDMDPINF